MARQQNQQRSTFDLTSKRLVELWDSGTPEDWRAFLGDIAPDSRWVIHGRALKGRCPVGTHSDSTPSFTIDLQRGHAKCWSSACEYFERNPVYFVKKVAKCTSVEAVTKMKERFGLKKFTKKLISELEGFDLVQRAKQAIFETSRNFLIDAYNKPEDPQFSYAQAAVKFYKDHKKIHPDTWHQLPIGVMPILQVFFDRYSSTDMELYKAIMAYLGQAYEKGWAGWMVFFNTRSAREIGRIRLRNPDPDAKGAVVALEDAFEHNVGLFGLNVYSSLMGHPVSKNAIVVEGEFDQLAIAASQIQTGKLDRIVVSKGGKTNNDVGDLVHVGVEQVYWIGDNDAAGRDQGLMLAKNLPDAIKSFRHFQWDAGDPHKFDPSDAVNLRGFEDSYEAFLDNTRYLFTYQVAYQRADKLLRQTSEADVKRREEIALDHAKNYLEDESQKKAFFKLVEQAYGLGYADLLRESMVSDDTFQGFARRLAEKLESYYTVIGTRNDGGMHGNSVEIMLWNKEKSDTRYLQLAKSTDCIAQMAMDTGSLLDWGQREIGIPLIMTHRFAKGDDGESHPIPLSLEQQKRNMKTAIMEALEIIAGRSQDIRGIRERTQGIHLLGSADGVIEAAVHNGKDTYLIRYEKEGSDLSRLENPLYRNNLFLPDVRSKWTESMNGDAILEDASAVVLQDVFRKLKDIVGTGWTFIHHDIDTTYCALLAMIMPYMSLFPGTLMTFISGAYSSGKTKLLRQFFSVSSDKLFGVVEPVYATENYTVAGIRQAMNNSAWGLVLDEFEDKGDGGSRSRVVRELLLEFRSMIADVAHRTQGSVSGKVREYSLNFPITMAAAHPPRELADLSRVVMLVMDQSKNRIPPDQAIGQKYSEKDIKELRQQVTLGLLPHIPELYRLYWSTKKEVMTTEIMPRETDSRFKETVIPLITLHRFLGHNWKKFAKDFAEAKRINENEYVGVRSEGEVILDALLDSVLLLDVSTFSGSTTLRGLLNQPKHRTATVNNANLGVYYTAAKNWLVVHWTHAESAILKGHRSILEGNRSPGQLKALCDVSEFSVPVKKAWPHIQHLFLGPGYSPKGVTVFDLTKALGEFMSEADLAKVTEIEEARKRRDEEKTNIPTAPEQDEEK